VRWVSQEFSAQCHLDRQAEHTRTALIVNSCHSMKSLYMLRATEKLLAAVRPHIHASTLPSSIYANTAGQMHVPHLSLKSKPTTPYQKTSDLVCSQALGKRRSPDEAFFSFGRDGSDTLLACMPYSLTLVSRGKSHSKPRSQPRLCMSSVFVALGCHCLSPSQQDRAHCTNPRFADG